MVYAIVPLHIDDDEALALQTKIENLASQNGKSLAPSPPVQMYDVHAPDIYFVTYEGTARELSEELGYGGSSDIGSGFIVRVSGGYYGYANRSLWDWLGVHNE